MGASDVQVSLTRVELWILLGSIREGKREIGEREFAARAGMEPMEVEALWQRFKDRAPETKGHEDDQRVVAVALSASDIDTLIRLITIALDVVEDWEYPILFGAEKSEAGEFRDKLQLLKQEFPDGDIVSR